MGTQLLHRCPQALAPRRHTALMELLWTSLCPSGQARTAGLHGACSKGEQQGKPCSNKYLKFSTATVVGFQATESFFLASQKHTIT